MQADPTVDLPVKDLGRQEYLPVHRQMLELLDSIRRGESRGEVWLLEHEPVYTAGRATKDKPQDNATPIVDIERGGQLTYHGPGQLVVYPIVPLGKHDVRRWLANLETFGVRFCGGFGLEATPSVDGTGVFVGTRKVASIGVAIRNWVNLHGIAINVNMDLAPFHRIRPCGLDPEVMSDLTRELQRPVTLQEAKAQALDALPVLLHWD